MKKDLFAKAKFGDHFVCRNGQPAVFLRWAQSYIGGADLYSFVILGNHNGAIHYDILYTSEGKPFTSMPNPTEDWEIVASSRESKEGLISRAWSWFEKNINSLATPSPYGTVIEMDRFNIYKDKFVEEMEGVCLEKRVPLHAKSKQTSQCGE